MSATRDDLTRLADEELMRLVADVDASAFELIYDRHAQAVYALCYRIAGSRALADDVCQEAFLSVWRSGDQYQRHLGSVRSWILSIAYNRAIDQLRRATRHETRQVHDDALAERMPAHEQTDVQAFDRMEAELTTGLLAELPADQRRVIELSFYSGYSHAEIAHMLDVPLGTVKGRMRLALEKLHVAMEGKR